MPFFQKNISSQVAICLIISISFIFSYKYMLRITSYSLYISVAYAVFLYWVTNYILNGARLVSSKLLYCAVALYAACIIAGFWVIDPAKLMVDRWSVITGFWDAARSGAYPYQAKSHIGCYPGPFPFYFLLAFPFYLLGDIGYLSLLGLLVMVVDINHYFKKDYRRRTAAIFLLLSSVAILWEMIARSTLLINSALILLYLMWMVSNKNHSVKQNVIMGMVGGLLMSTRGIYAIPIILCCTYCFLKPWKIKELMVYSCAFVAVFILTLVPFVLWDLQLFLKYNPFVLQGDLIGFHIALALMVLAVVVGFLVKTEKQVYLGTGLMIYGAVAIYFINCFIGEGFNPQFLQYHVDIAYFLLALPFLLLSL